MSGKKDFLANLKSIKYKQQKQINLIQSKAEEDNNLLTNVISYLRKRIEIEKEYNKNMEKNNKAFQAKVNKSVKSSTESLNSNNSEDNPNLRLVPNAFNVMINQSMKLIERNQKNCDTIQNNVITVLQDLLKSKELSYKKKVDNLMKIKDEIFKTYGELERTREAYESNEKDSQNQKNKYEEACTEPKGALGQMKNMLRSGDSGQRIEKYHQKWETSQLNSTNARNEYLVYIDLINLQNNQFYDSDCPTIMKSIDDNYYESMASIFDMITNLSVDYSNDLNNSITSIQNAIKKINRDEDNKIFLTQNESFFKKPEPFVYDPYGSDTVSSIILNDNTKHQLSMLLEIFNKQLMSIEQNIDKSNRELQGIEQLIQVYSDKPSFGNAEDSISQRNEIKEQLEKLNKERNIYSTIVNKLKGVGVELERPVIIGSLHKKAVALYDFTADQANQLSFKENEVLTVLDQEGNGWVKAQIGAKIGLVPEDYIKIIDSSNKSLNSTPTGSIKQVSSMGSVSSASKKKTVTKNSSTSNLSKSVKSVIALFDYNASDSTELSFKTGDVIDVIKTSSNEEKIENQWWTGKNRSTNQTGQFPVVFTKGWDSSKVKTTKTSSIHKEKVLKVKALYDYEATCEGELSISVGDIITVTNQNTGSSSWWEGTGPKGHGQFPSIYVQEITGTVKSSTPKTKTLKKVRALYDYTAQNPDELSFKAYDIIEVTEETNNSNDWWMGRLNSQVGLFPRTYIENI